MTNLVTSFGGAVMEIAALVILASAALVALTWWDHQRSHRRNR